MKSNGDYRHLSWLLPRGIVSCALLTIVISSEVTADQPSTEHSDSYIEEPIGEFDRDHWSFQPLSAVTVPNTGSAWCRNPIDQFVLTNLRKRDLVPQAAASRQTLIRRLRFDLTGLPPSPEEVRAFLDDPSDEAYEYLIDRLLFSPQYGERWAQHWLDLARFAETDGFEHDKVRPNAWQYRDWVIAAFNRDLPYDEFIRQQIAGDEYYPDDPSARVATRFCLSGPDMPDINLTEERRHTVLNELTSTVGEVVLGLQIGCAQCHDHKYDPISQADFYRFRASFEPALKLRKNKSLSSLDESVPYDLPSHLMLRGDFRRQGPKVLPGVIRVVAAEDYQFETQPKPHTAGRRTALSEWLVSPNNPLTSRVIVNRLWQHHFGKGLVDTPSEFGVMGSEPSHPELLDWLALRLIEEDWSLRRLNRLIVSSATYRQRSQRSRNTSSDEEKAWQRSLEEDPTAEQLSRFPRRRLEGEAIRDAILVASGQLNCKSGGPGVLPPLPKELVGTLLKNQWPVTQDVSEHRRRSIYVFARRNLRYPIFEVFDRPSANASCSARQVSTTATQSLHLLNSESSLEAARAMAQSLMAEHTTQSAQIDAAFWRTLGRDPTDVEFDDVMHFLSESKGTTEECLAHLCLSLFNCNEFVTVD